MTAVATLVSQARKAAGLTQAELAARAGMQQPVIARLERPGANPTVATLARVMRATGHTLSAVPAESGVDRDLIRRQLALTPADRLRRLDAQARTMHLLTGAGRRSRGRRS